MALHEEQIAKAVIDQLQVKLPGELILVYARTDTSLPLPPPRAESYLIGRPEQYTAYQAPTLFVTVARVNRPDEGSGQESANFRKQRHDMTIMCVVEGAEEDKLTKRQWRYAEAIDAAIHDKEMVIPSPSPSNRSHKVFVTRIEYGPQFTAVKNEQRIFRSDVRVHAAIENWEQLTPMA